MLLRQKITLAFILLAALSLLLFSIYIYVASARYRMEAFQERLRNKALATREIYELHDKVAERIIMSIPEQSEYVFDENDHMIFSINDVKDLDFTKELFDKIRKSKEHYFQYQGDAVWGYKEGLGFAFTAKDKPRIIIITAYNSNGFLQLDNLVSLLIWGNIVSLILIGLVGYLVVGASFRPFKQLVTEAESIQGHEPDFRLSFQDNPTEIGVLSKAFNQALARIQTLSSLQKSFISYASHELRTPMAAVAGILETSITYDKSIETVRNNLKMAQRELHKATQLLSGLLQLAKLDTLQVHVEHTNCNLLDICFDAIRLMESKHPEQKFSFSVDPAMIDQLVEVAGNEQLLRTALINVIDNAAKFSSGQKVDISLSAKEGMWLIEVKDQGICIQESDRPRIGEPLYRGKNVKQVEGFGLGLALTRRIVDHHNGRIQFLPNEPQGTIVQIFFPISPAA